MPILEIELVGEPEPARRRDLARRLADAAGEALGARPGGTWVRLRVLPEEDYAESGGAPVGVRPVFAHVLKRTWPEGGPDPEEVRRLTEAVADAVGREPGVVHVRYEAPGGGRQAFGGQLV